MGEEEINLADSFQRLIEIERAGSDAKAKHNAYLAELGLRRSHDSGIWTLGFPFAINSKLNRDSWISVGTVDGLAAELLKSESRDQNSCAQERAVAPRKISGTAR